MLTKIAYQFFQKVNPQPEAGIPTLETDRLRLRAPRRSDYASILALGSDPEVMRYISNGKIQSPRDARSDLEQRIRLSKKQHGYWIAEDRHTGTFIGWMALKPLAGKAQLELGYRFLRKHWGKGYATEAGKRLLQYAFQELDLSEVVAVTLPENRASRRVMEKLGFRLLGHDTFHGFYCVVYRLAAEDFSP